MCSCKFMIQIQSSEEIRVSGRVLLYYSYFQFYQHSKSNTITLLPLQNGICSYCIIPFWLYTCVKYRYIYKYNCPSNLRSKYHPLHWVCSFLNQFPGTVLFLLCIFENQQGNQYLKPMWSHVNNLKNKRKFQQIIHFKYNIEVWKTNYLSLFYFVTDNT